MDKLMMHALYEHYRTQMVDGAKVALIGQVTPELLDEMLNRKPKELKYLRSRDDETLLDLVVGKQIMISTLDDVGHYDVIYCLAAVKDRDLELVKKITNRLTPTGVAFFETGTGASQETMMAMEYLFQAAGLRALFAGYTVPTSPSVGAALFSCRRRDA